MDGSPQKKDRAKTPTRTLAKKPAKIKKEKKNRAKSPVREPTVKNMITQREETLNNWSNSSDMNSLGHLLTKRGSTAARAAITGHDTNNPPHDYGARFQPKDILLQQKQPKLLTKQSSQYETAVRETSPARMQEIKDTALAKLAFDKEATAKRKSSCPSFGCTAQGGKKRRKTKKRRRKTRSKKRRVKKHRKSKTRHKRKRRKRKTKRS